MPEVTLGLAGPFSHGRVITEYVKIPNPAAGADFTYSVSGAYWERPVSLFFVLTIDATDIGRTVILNVSNSDGIVAQVNTATGVNTGGSSINYSFLTDISTVVGAAAAGFMAPLPGLFLQPTWTLGTAIASIQAADQISAIILYRERFITGPGGYEIGATFYEDPSLHRTQVFADELA